MSTTRSSYVLTAARVRRACVVGTALGLAALAHAQEREPKILEVPAREASSADIAIDQISPRRLPRTPARETVEPPAQASAATERGQQVQPPVQLSSGDRGARPAQLSTGERTTTTPQLATGGRSAQAAAPLSSTDQSRPAPLTRLTGPDRCDAARAEGDAACARVIETRSAEFTAPERPTLSPEQRLLIDQRVREAPAGAESAARRLARNEMDPSALDNQSIASVVLQRPPAAPTQPQDEASGLQGFDQPTIDIIQAIVEGLGGNAQNPTVVPPR